MTTAPTKKDCRTCALEWVDSHRCDDCHGQNGYKNWIAVRAAPTAPQPNTEPEPMSNERIIKLAREVLEKPVIDGKPAALQLAEGIARAIESAAADAWRSHIAARDAELERRIADLTTYRPFSDGPLPGMVRGGDYVKLSDVRAAIDRAGGKA